MMCSFIPKYLLVVLWIQNSVEGYMSIHANPTPVLAGEEYSITCQTTYPTVWLAKGRVYIASNNDQQCSFNKSVNSKDYRCSAKSHGSYRTLKLTVFKAEDYPTKIRWSCVKSGSSYTKYLQITIVANVSDSDSPPVSEQTSSDETNVMLIAVCSGVVVMVMFITMIIVVYKYNKVVGDQANQGPVTPLTQELGGFPANPDYYGAHAQSSRTDWVMDNEDFASPYDTALAEDVPEKTNPHFDSSKVYGVVNKTSPWTDMDGDAEPSNPNFDPDKVYGLVNKN